MNELIQIRIVRGVTLTMPKYTVKGKWSCLVQTIYCINLHHRNGKYGFKRVMHRTLWNSLQELFLFLPLIFSRVNILPVPDVAWKEAQVFPMLQPSRRPGVLLLTSRKIMPPSWISQWLHLVVAHSQPHRLAIKCVWQKKYKLNYGKGQRVQKIINDQKMSFWPICSH